MIQRNPGGPLMKTDETEMTHGRLPQMNADGTQMERR
jgi:hypothetical protein